jgi:hypothetical protein
MKSPSHMLEEPKEVNFTVMAPISLRFWRKNYFVGYVLEQSDFCVVERRCQLLILNALSGIKQWAWSIGEIILTGSKRNIWRKITFLRTNLAWNGLSSNPYFYTDRQKTKAWAMTRPQDGNDRRSLNRNWWWFWKMVTIQWQYLRRENVEFKNHTNLTLRKPK